MCGYFFDISCAQEDFLVINRYASTINNKQRNNMKYRNDHTHAKKALKGVSFHLYKHRAHAFALDGIHWRREFNEHAARWIVCSPFSARVHLKMRTNRIVAQVAALISWVHLFLWHCDAKEKHQNQRGEIVVKCVLPHLMALQSRQSMGNGKLSGAGLGGGRVRWGRQCSTFFFFFFSF